MNGLWEYAITDLGGNVPAHFDGQILVPFAVESSLSGVGQRVGAKRNYGIPVHLKCLLLGKIKMYYFISVLWTGKQIFGVNDVKVGSHTGGFTPFSFDTRSVVW